MISITDNTIKLCADIGCVVDVQISADIDSVILTAVAQVGHESRRIFYSRRIANSSFGVGFDGSVYLFFECAREYIADRL